MENIIIDLDGLKALFRLRKRSVQGCAAYIGISENYLASAINGKEDFSFLMIRGIKEYLNIDCGFIDAIFFPEKN